MNKNMIFTGRQDITSIFAMRNGVPHNGLDIVSRTTDISIHPVESGRVLQARIVTDKNNLTWQWGYYVSIQWTNNPSIVDYYCHMEAQPLVKPGMIVTSETVLGYMGNTGYSFGAHTHFERRVNGKAIIPIEGTGYENKLGIYYPSSASVGIPSISTLYRITIDPVSDGDLEMLIGIVTELKIQHTVLQSSHTSPYGNKLSALICDPVSTGDLNNIQVACENKELNYTVTVSKK